jgi:hypothetical protein
VKREREKVKRGKREGERRRVREGERTCKASKY